MILVDANLLIYAANNASPLRPAARRWLDAQLGGRTRVALPWPCLLAFLRITTNPLIFGASTSSLPDAWKQVDEWLSAPAAWIPEAGSGHAAILGRLLAHPAMTSRKVTDAHLAALAIEHGLTLCSTDGDFSLFKELRWENPLR